MLASFFAASNTMFGLWVPGIVIVIVALAVIGIKKGLG